VDPISIIIITVLILILVLLAAYSDQINDFIENRVNRATRYAKEIQALLCTFLGAILTELWEALTMADWFKVMIFALIVFFIIVAIWDIGERSKYRERWLDSQYMRNLTALIKDAVKDVVKDAVKQTLREERKEAKEAKKKKEDGGAV
jgi:uncharacterized membrane protein YfbV (UPF0208 family)